MKVGSVSKLPASTVESHSRFNIPDEMQTRTHHPKPRLTTYNPVEDCEEARD